MDNNSKFGEFENEIKVLDLKRDDILRIDNVLENLGARRVSNYDRRIRTLDNGFSQVKDQLLRITDEEGHTKVSLHLNQSNESEKKHIKFHLPQSDKIVEMLEARYDEKVITDTTAKRISYELGSDENCIDFDIDMFSAIPPFMEIDLSNLQKNGYTLKDLLIRLGLQDHKCIVAGTEAIHKLYGVDYFEVYSTQKQNNTKSEYVDR